MTIKYVLAVKNGSYTAGDGSAKNRWVYIGHIHTGQNGHYMTLDPTINLAAFPRKEGDNRLMVSMFEPREKEGGAPKQSQRPAPPADPEFDDEIPF